MRGVKERQVIMWALHRVSLATHDLEAARYFFETHIGLGPPSSRDDNSVCFGQGSRGLRIERPRGTLINSQVRFMARLVRIIWPLICP